MAAESQAATGRHHSARLASATVRRNCPADHRSAAADPTSVTGPTSAATDPISAAGHRNCRAIGPTSAPAHHNYPREAPVRVDLPTCRPLVRTSADVPALVTCRTPARVPSRARDSPIALAIARAACQAWARAGPANCPRERRNSAATLCKIGWQAVRGFAVNSRRAIGTSSARIGNRIAIRFAKTGKAIAIKPAMIGKTSLTIITAGTAGGMAVTRRVIGAGGITCGTTILSRPRSV